MVAHINDMGNEQTVEEHCENTAKLCYKEGKRAGIGNVCYEAGLFHDLGKNKEEFDTYIRKSAEGNSSVKRGEIDHSTAGGQFIFKNFCKTDRLTAELIANAVFSHHGIRDIIDENGNEVFLTRTEKENIQYEEVIENSREIIENNDPEGIFRLACKEVKDINSKIIGICKESGNSQEAAYFMLGCLQRLITSVLIDADRSDTAEFMTGIGYRETDNCQKLWEIYAERLNQRLGEFRYDNKISKLRKQMSEECFKFAGKEGGIYCLPVPTGGGKTLASLRYALEHSRIFNKRRIVYIAPYLSILEQNAKEIRNILKDDKNILEHHSNIIIEDEDEKNNYRYLSEGWTSPVILTSMVRFLETLFSSDTASVRRFNRLTDSVIIIDEIQNLPVKVVDMFNVMADFLAYVCNATIILCSATQPLLNEADKKILYGLPRNMINVSDEITEGFRRVRITDRTRTKRYTTEELADFILEKTDKNMLVILNTKGAVRKLCDELESRNTEYKIYQLTTYMCPQHRNDVIDKIKEEINEGEKLICVSTQLIEAGVDISFENVTRSLAGLDSIIQAAGRCNRHGKTEIKNVYIINYIEERLGSLEDIKRGQECMEDLLLYYKDNYENLGDDYLLSKEAIDKYYKKYFHRRCEEMRYIINDPINTDLFSLLADNKSVKAIRKRKKGTLTAQSYKLAGDKFEVIDSNTVGVIVPYGDGKEKIEKLMNTQNMSDIKELLKELQRYTVNLYRTDRYINELKSRNALISCFDNSVYILSPGFYNEDTGLSSELENCIF